MEVSVTATSLLVRALLQSDMTEMGEVYELKHIPARLVDESQCSVDCVHFISFPEVS